MLNTCNITITNSFSETMKRLVEPWTMICRASIVCPPFALCYTLCFLTCRNSLQSLPPSFPKWCGNIKWFQSVIPVCGVSVSVRDALTYSGPPLCGQSLLWLESAVWLSLLFFIFPVFLPPFFPLFLPCPFLRPIPCSLHCLSFVPTSLNIIVENKCR